MAVTLYFGLIAMMFVIHLIHHKHRKANQKKALTNADEIFDQNTKQPTAANHEDQDQHQLLLAKTSEMPQQNGMEAIEILKVDYFEKTENKIEL